MKACIPAITMKRRKMPVAVMVPDQVLVVDEEDGERCEDHPADHPEEHGQADVQCAKHRAVSVFRRSNSSTRVLGWGR